MGLDGPAGIEPRLARRRDALHCFGLNRFLTDRQVLLKEVTRGELNRRTQ